MYIGVAEYQHLGSSEKDIEETAKTLFGTQARPSSQNEEDHVDLNNVLSTVEDYRTQIAHITDDDERRQTAARVALGLMSRLALT